MKTTSIDVRTLNRTLRNLRIAHGNFKTAFMRGKDLFHLSDRGMPGSGIMVFGPSGVGKTTLTHALVDYGHKHFGPDSVMRTQLSSGTTIKGVISSLLFGFGDPRANSGTAYQLSRRLVNTIKARSCRVIIVDETQHLIPGGAPSKTLVDNILNSFKILDESDVSFVLAGMESITQLWDADAQIRSRFQTPYFLDTLHYPKDRRIWGGIVNKYRNTIEEFGLSVDCSEFEDRLYAATKGAMRSLMLILTTAICEAVEAGKTVVTVDHLHSATQKQTDEQDGLPNAFDVDLEQITRFNREAHTKRKLAPMHRGLGDILST